MTSTRLPGKVLVPLCGQPVLGHIARRLRRARELDAVAIATTTNATDDPVAALAVELSVPCFRGSEHDVLSRYLGAAQAVGATAIVRITADCPFVDPAIVDRVVRNYREGDADYVSDTLERSYPIGMDVEVFSLAALETAAGNAVADDEREHVTLHIYRHPDRFRLRNLSAPEIHARPTLRLTLDTPGDLALTQAVYEGLYSENPMFDLSDILAFLDTRPEVVALNQDVPHKWVSTQ
tara:strand:- start:38 stop:748 length:711 start_codon:yes stop_codon:yes gene_type:complete